jgi:hypothetical protein
MRYVNPDPGGFGDDVAAAAMIDRLVHHAEVVALKGDSYRLKDRDLGRVPNRRDQRAMKPKVVSFRVPSTDQFSRAINRKRGKHRS